MPVTPLVKQCWRVARRRAKVVAMQQPPLLNGALEIALYADDLDACAAFWSGIIGLAEIARVQGRHVFFRCGAQILLIFDARATRLPPAPDARLPVPPHGTTGAGHFCMSAAADQIAVWHSYLQGRGIVIEADIRWPNGARSIYFRDPAGNSIEIADAAIWQ